MLIATRRVLTGPLAQSAERGADNAKVVSSTLTRTKDEIFLACLFHGRMVQNFSGVEGFVHRFVRLEFFNDLEKQTEH